MPPTKSNKRSKQTVAGKRSIGLPVRATKAAAATTEAASSTSSSSTQSGAIFFWRETEPETGWLSQWYQCDFTDEDGEIRFKSAEHYMMYQKALLFGDSAMGEQILAASHPREVKALGRKVANFDDAKWLAERERIVRDGTRLKFTRAVSEEGLQRGHAASAPLVAPLSLRSLLLSTGDREIVEASPMDRIWGVGFGAKKAEQMRARWGLNLLGKALMHVRDEFRREEEEDGGRVVG